MIGCGDNPVGRTAQGVKEMLPGDYREAWLDQRYIRPLRILSEARPGTMKKL